MSNRYEYVKVIQGNYGHGWEDLSEYADDDKTIRDDLREYRVACSNPHKIISRRYLNGVSQ